MNAYILYAQCIYTVQCCVCHPKRNRCCFFFFLVFLLFTKIQLDSFLCSPKKKSTHTHKQFVSVVVNLFFFFFSTLNLNVRYWSSFAAAQFCSIYIFVVDPFYGLVRVHNSLLFDFSSIYIYIQCWWNFNDQASTVIAISWIFTSPKQFSLNSELRKKKHTHTRWATQRVGETVSIHSVHSDWCEKNRI